MKNLDLFKLNPSNTSLPLFLSNIQAGFPSPADGYLEAVISLDDICIPNPSSTILGRIKGDSLKDIGIYEGDIAVIDKSLKPKNYDLVVCAIDGEFTAKILQIDKDGIKLIAANQQFKPIIIEEFTKFQVWGIITFVIQDIKSKARGWNYRL
jgi:DNA polymerase V